MRIIGGIHKRRRFALPKNFEARPTTDFAKENIFNVVDNLIDLEETTQALDLFSGTGSIGFELVSRGCQQVTCIEKKFQHYQYICKIRQELKADNMQVLNGDVFRFLQNTKQTFDFIFADPPFNLKELPDVPHTILSKNLLKEGGLFIMEHPKEYDFSALPLFFQRRVYGAVNFSLFFRQEEEK